LALNKIKKEETMLNLAKIGIMFFGIILLACVNVFTQQIDLREIDAEFKRMDANRDRLISAQEMQTYQEKRFNELDKDKNGSIDLTELEADKTKMLQNADNDKNKKVSQEEAAAEFKEHFSAMDTNKDGKVTKEEYKKYWPVTVKF
jgi:Ca2+-binding EF-hand superfamily protein